MCCVLAVLGLGAVPAITSRRGSVSTIGATWLLRQVLSKDNGRRGLTVEQPAEHAFSALSTAAPKEDRSVPTLQMDHSRLNTHTHSDRYHSADSSLAASALCIPRTGDSLGFSFPS